MLDGFRSRIMTVRTMSANEAKQNWGALMRAAREDDGLVIVESHGKPKVIVLSYDEYEAFQTFKEEQRRKELLRRLDAFEARWGGRNTDLSDEQIEEVAVRAGRDINRGAAERHKDRFKSNPAQ